MKESNDLLDHLEKVHDEYGEVVDKVSTEDKLVMAGEESVKDLDPWEISEITRGVLRDLPQGLEGHADGLFDIVYGAISEAMYRLRG